MIDPANYDKPQSLRQLMEGVLSSEELGRFKQAQEVLCRIGWVPSARYSPEHFDAFQDWKSLGIKVLAGLKRAVESNDLIVYGWGVDQQARDIDRKCSPAILNPEWVAQALGSMLRSIHDRDIYTDSGWDLEIDNLWMGNLWIDEYWHLSCFACHYSADLPIPEGTQQTRPTEYQSDPNGASRAGAPGRPLTENMRACLLRAEELYGDGKLGVTKDAAAEQAAEEFGENPDTVRTNMRPSRRPKSMQR